MIVLIQPKAEGYNESLNNPAIPLALLSCTSLLANEFDVKIIDQRLTSRWKKDLLKILEQNPLCVGVTSITGKQIRHALEVSRFVKEHSSVPVVWGGVHASLLPGQTLENPCIDMVVKGEGEITFYELVKALKKGKSLKGIKGVWYKKNGKIYNNPDRSFVDLNKLPQLPYHLIDVRRYIQKRGGKKSLHIQTSRGCPYSCKFCFNQVYYKSQLRTFSQDRILANLSFLKKFNVNHFWIVDDNFFANTKVARNICNQFIKEGLDTVWEAPGSSITDLLRFNDFKLLERSRCEQLYFGVESGSNKVLRHIGKNLTCKQVLKINRLIKNFNIAPFYNFMVGFPGETKEDIKATLGLILKLLKENKQTRISPLYSFTPYPGTKLFDLAVQSGFVQPSTLEEWSFYEWKTTNLPWIPREYKTYFERLYFWSIFLDDKYKFELTSPLIKTGIKFSLPVLKKIAISKIKNF